MGVSSVSGASGVGKAQTITEFAANAETPQGKNLVSVLNASYGRSGGSSAGRLLWKTYDDSEGAYVSAMQEVIDRYAADLERRL